MTWRRSTRSSAEMLFPTASKPTGRRCRRWSPTWSDVEEIDDVFGGDAFPYGLEANRATLQALIAYMVEQHFIARAIPIEDLFVPLAGAIAT